MASTASQKKIKATLKECIQRHRSLSRDGSGARRMKLTHIVATKNQQQYATVCTIATTPLTYLVQNI
eukprot:6195605-Amphidinium_carterae.2